MLSANLSHALRELSRREGVTLFMTLLAAFQTLLYRYSGQEDILVGTPIANRNRAETEALIGFFVNTLVLRGRVSAGMSFGELLKGAREACLEAYAHQDVPFEKLVEELQPERSLSHSPLFQVMFILQNAPAEELRLSTLEIGGVGVESGVTKFDLTLALADVGEEIAGSFEYRSDLFDAATIRRMAEHFERLLEALVEDAQQGLGQVSLLNEAERERLLEEWNETGVDYGARPSSLHRLFEEQAARTPDAVAVVCEGRQMTYAELDARANRLAQHLSELGVAPEARVGVLLEHSFETVVGLLGVLKAGGAYVPLDAQTPPERLRFMLEDAGVAVVLTQQRTRERLPVGLRAAEVCLDSDVQAFAHQSADNLQVNVSPANTAYIIYTSGSTGRPKGVSVQHASVVNYILWAADEYLGGESLAFPLYSSLAFDLTVTSIYTPLVSGGQVVIYDRAGGAGMLEEILQDDRVDVLKLTPGHLALIKDRDNRQSRVRLLVVGGEALETELARAVHESFGGRVRVVNEYGPTEATVGCMIYRYGAERDARAFVPIGRPAANAQVYVLDESLQPAPVGVSGQLYVGGDGLARGYQARPDLTAESFIPDPFSREAGRRLYRTGDKARHLETGQIEFLGRADEQLKVRGYRVEPGEIESVLMQHESVGACVVAARETAGVGKALAAYVVLRDGAAMPGGGEWREHLRETLPEYMLPQWFVQIPEVPLTPNGKVDRQALPAPAQLRPELSENYLAARTPVEATLVKIWSEVLGVAQVGVYDDFFELGGHSLLAARMMTRLRETFRVHVALRTVFEQPTVAYLSECVEEALRSQG
jgi:amino acid adenylation domain-containing protein